jgi:hypothetical protein
MSVRISAWTTGRIFMKSDIWASFEKSLVKIQMSLQSDTNDGYCAWRPTYILIVSLSFFLGIRIISGKICRENQNTILYSVTFFQNSCRLWCNVEKYCTAGHGMPQLAIWRMRIACWLNKATNWHSICVILAAFPPQQRTLLIVTSYAHCLSRILICIRTQTHGWCHIKTYWQKWQQSIYFV